MGFLMCSAILKKSYIRIKECRYGWMMFNINDAPIGKCLNVYGEWAQQEMELLEQFVTPGDTILDIGAHIGNHTLFFAREVKRSGRVLSFEPQRIIYQMLTGNIAMNALQNVFTIQNAVSDRDGFVNIPFIDPHHHCNFGSVFPTDLLPGEKVQCMPIDNLKLSSCDLIKIDVEGSEIAVLKGASKTIQKFHPIIYVEHNQEEHFSELMNILQKFDYRCWLHTYHRYNPDNFYEIKENKFAEDSIESNILCIHRKIDVSHFNLTTLKPIM